MTISMSDIPSLQRFYVRRPDGCGGGQRTTESNVVSINIEQLSTSGRSTRRTEVPSRGPNQPLGGKASVIGVKAAARLATEAAHPDHLLEQVGRVIAGLLGLLVHRHSHVMDDVEADQVAQREGPHRVVEAELDDLV